MYPLARRLLVRAFGLALVAPPQRAPAAWFATQWEEPTVSLFGRSWTPSAGLDTRRAETYIAQLDAGAAALASLLAEWEAITSDPSNGDIIRRRLGTVGITSPLRDIERVLRYLRTDLVGRGLLRDEVGFVEAQEEFLNAVKQADFLAYSAVFGGSCCGGGRTSEPPSPTSPQKLALAPVEPGESVGGGAAASKAAVLKSERRDYLQRAKLEVQRAADAYALLQASVQESGNGRLLQTARVEARQIVVKSLSVAAAVEIIRKECDPAFLAAVRDAGGQLLYRGEELPAAACWLAPPPDLLQLDTYGSQDAVRYFESLERGLPSRVVARPSSGHIAVARREAAALWGDAVSVWPLGRALHYVWPRARDDFWPATADEAAQGVRACRVDEGLAEALKLGREVLFASEGSADFIAISASADMEVRRRLLSM